MIFPYLLGLVRPWRAPVTYFLLAVNLFVFLVTLEAYNTADKAMDEIVTDDEFLTTQGSAFAVMISHENARSPETFSKTLDQLSRQSLSGEIEARRVLGSLALRNREFMARAESYQFDGDEVALALWSEKFAKLKSLQEAHPSFQWGITSRNDNWIHWFTYQFAHSGWAHLFWNMIFLLVFGVFVERALGSAVVIFTYLGGGLVGALAFSVMSGISSSPLIGASAAISGLMGLVTVAFWKKRLKFFYWLLPLRGYHGFVFLPAWVVMIVYASPDLSGYLSAVPEMGSVAYAAHLGGTFFGLIMAMGLARAGRAQSSQPAV